MRRMFYGATAFNQDLTEWCVSNITTEPDNFSTNSALIEENKPNWGECPFPTAINEFLESKIIIYPNPVKHKLIIQSSYSYPLEIVIINVAGEKILKEKVEGRNSEIDLNHAVSGLYLVKLVHENEIIHQQKIVKY